MAMPAPVVVPTYTIDDLEHFPDDGNRYELLDGVLLVTPAPMPPHQVVIAELMGDITLYVKSAGLARVVSPGAVEIAPKTHLEPDLLVFPATEPLNQKWAAIRRWWLAVEVFSDSSVIYDRDFKRDAYLAMGVAEVWLVDWWDRAVYVSRGGAPKDVLHRETLSWHPAGMPDPLHFDLEHIFRDLP
jgi:Uma2 family endonuclease